MNRRRKLPIKEQMQAALDDIGGEPLDGSGFEEETPEAGFSEDVAETELPPS